MEKIIELSRVVNKQDTMPPELEGRCKEFLRVFSEIFSAASDTDRPRLTLIIGHIVEQVSKNSIKLKLGLAEAMKGEAEAMANLCQQKNDLRWVSSLKPVYWAIQKGLTPEDREFLKSRGLTVNVPQQKAKKAAFQFNEAEFSADLLGKPLDPNDPLTQEKIANTISFAEWLRKICRNDEDYDAVMSAMAKRIQAYSKDDHRGGVSRNGVRHHAGAKLRASHLSDSFKNRIGLENCRTMNSDVDIESAVTRAFLRAAGLPCAESPSSDFAPQP